MDPRLRMMIVLINITIILSDNLYRNIMLNIMAF